MNYIHHFLRRMLQTKICGSIELCFMMVIGTKNHKPILSKFRKTSVFRDSCNIQFRRQSPQNVRVVCTSTSAVMSVSSQASLLRLFGSNVLIPLSTCDGDLKLPAKSGGSAHSGGHQRIQQESMSAVETFCHG